MKNVLPHIVAIIFVTAASAQEVDYNKIILPSNLTNISIEEKLVQLAWRNHPENKNALLENQVSVYDLKLARWSWLDNIRIQTNLNEFTLDKTLNGGSASPLDRANFYPRYNFGLYMTLYPLAEVPLNVKSKKAMVEISENKTKSKMLAVRTEVLTLYNLYLLAKEKMIVQKDIEQDTYANFKLLEQHFKDGQENVQTYNNILERYTTQKIKKLESETEFKIAKINLEQLIGIKLEDVISN